MRFLLLSDIHANLEALEAVVADASGLYQQVVCLGDIVGYGPDPNTTTEWVQENCAAVIRGNHDRAAIDLEEAQRFNPVAALAAGWTNSAMSESNLEYLNQLPSGPLDAGGFDLVHGSVLDEDQYVVDPTDAVEPLRAQTADLVFFGHTHLQGGFSCHNSDRCVVALPAAGLLSTSRGQSYLINPGSVGQPRDEDWKAAYAIYDTATGEVEFRRCEYDVEATQRKIVDAGLPGVLAERLALGR